MATPKNVRYYLMSLLVIMLLAATLFPSLIKASTTNVVNSQTKNGNSVSASVAQEKCYFKEDIKYIFNESGISQEYSIKMDCAFGYLNQLVLYFKVEGDQSDSNGINITFKLPLSTVSYVIEKPYQSENLQYIQYPFSYPTEASGNYAINITIKAKTGGVSGEGILTILSNSYFEKIELPTISISQNTELPVIPKDVVIFGSTLSLKRAKAMSAFNINELENSESLELKLNISFTANNVNAFSKQVEFIVNNKSLYKGEIRDVENYYSFDVDLTDLQEGCNIILLNFELKYSSETLNITNITISSSINENKPTEVEVFKSIHWIGALDAEVDISSLKPESIIKEQKLALTIFYNYMGSTIYPGITVELWQGLTLLYSTQISAAEQTETINKLEIYTYTTNYDKPLKLHFFGNNPGEGILNIYNNSKLDIEPIIHYNNNIKIKRLLASNLFVQANSSSDFVSFYDVIYAPEFTVNLTLNFDLIKENVYIPNDATITLIIKKDGVMLSSAIITSQDNYTVNLPVELDFGYNEFEFVLSLAGKLLKLEIISASYAIFPSSAVMNEDNNWVSIPLFKTPKSIAIGLFVLFDCWLVLGIFIRLYQGRKIKKKHELENDEFILEITQIETY